MSERLFGRQIIQNLLDTDFYKLTMMQAVLHRHPDAEVEYEFRCRNGEDLRPYVTEIREEIDRLAEIRITPDQLAFLERMHLFKADFIRTLALFRFNPAYVQVSIEAHGEVCLRVRGPWVHTILFEVPLLAIISEVRNRRCYPDVVLERVRAHLYDKLDWLQQAASVEELARFQLIDFGTRRRFSYRVQEEMVYILKRDFPGRFLGTSSVHLAREYAVPAMGTMAHEWLMAHQQLGPRLRDSQVAALEGWVQEYRGQLGIALTDTINMDAFLQDFDLYFAKLFDGLRHDSGDPLLWAEKAINHYQRLGIDPRTQTLVFSDGLTLPRALEILRAVNGRAQVSFGIGTRLACDIPGVEPVNIVIKMTACNGQPVAKISDSPGKTVCRDKAFVTYLHRVFAPQGAKY